MRKIPLVSQSRASADAIDFRDEYSRLGKTHIDANSTKGKSLKENTRFARRRSSGRVLGKTNVYFPGLVSSPQRARDKGATALSARSDQSDGA